MKRALLAILGVIALYFVGRTIYVGLASDETKIRWLLLAEQASFNGASMWTALDGFHEDYRDETVGVDKASLKRAVTYLFAQQKDKESGRFRYRVELPEDALQIELAKDGKTAVARFPLRLYQGLDEREKLDWELRVTAQLEKGEDWAIARSTHETVTGAQPGGR